jgi:serine/threonine-protein kinase
MELLDGIDLDALVRKHGSLPPERVAHILRQLCASLGEAHRMDLIHRDVKPANIFVCKRAFEYDFVKVLDFGLVRKHSAVDPEAPSDNLSKIGVVMGTPAYIAPEVIHGEPADARSDLYAVGCVAYWLLTGKKVFESQTLAALLVAHASEEPEAPSERTDARIPAEFDALVLDCLAKEPNGRVQTAEECVQRLNQIEFQDSWSPERAETWWEGVDA